MLLGCQDSFTKILHLQKMDDFLTSSGIKLDEAHELDRCYFNVPQIILLKEVITSSLYIGSDALVRATFYTSNFIILAQQDQISRLNQENGALKQNLDGTSAAVNGFRYDSNKAASSTSNAVEVLFKF